MSLNEIKTDTVTANDLFRFDKYIPYFKCRKLNGNSGGGVALLVKDTIESEEIKLPFENVIGVKIRLKNKVIAIFSYYNPPSTSSNKRNRVTSNLNENIFNFIQNNFSEYIIMGDLNAKFHPLNLQTNKNGEI